MKRGTPRHPKVKVLSQLLNIEHAHAVGILEMLWQFTAEFAPRGDIGRVDDKTIAEAVGWQRPSGAKGVSPECKLSEALVTSGWLERSDECRLIVHDWPDHAEDSVHMKLARQLLYFADGSKPRRTRLTGPERKAADEFYRDVVRTDSNVVRTACAPSKAKARHGSYSSSSLVESSKETTTPEVSPAIQIPTEFDPIRILAEGKTIWKAAGVPVSDRHEQQILQYLVDIEPPERRARVLNYAKWSLAYGKWPNPSKTKTFLSLLQSGDWDVDLTVRSLPQSTVNRTLTKGESAQMEAERLFDERRRQREAHN